MVQALAHFVSVSGRGAEERVLLGLGSRAPTPDSVGTTLWNICEATAHKNVFLLAATFIRM